MPIDYDHHNREMKRLRAEFEKFFHKRILKAAKDLEFRVTPGTKHLCWLAWMSKARPRSVLDLTFASSEIIYIKASNEVEAARDRFIAAYESSKDAGLLDCPENTKNEAHVQINEEYRHSILELGMAIMKEHNAENIWLHCMREENPDLN